MYRLVGAHGAGPDGLLQAVGPLHDGGHCAAVERLGQGVPGTVRLRKRH
jgi:hypothetical protein